MKKRRKPLAREFQDIRLSKSLSRWFIVQTLMMVGVGFFTTIFIDQISSIFKESQKPDAFRILTIIAALILILGIFEILQYRLIKRHLEKICDTIERLAHGDYGYKLRPGKFDVFKSIGHDINILSEELETVQMFRDDFVNSYSHEFKTPIASIKGFAQLLLEDDNLPEETRRQYLQIIVDESTRLTSLAGNTILLSQLDTQKIVTDKKLYSLDEQLRRCVIMLSNLWGEKNIEVQGDFCEIVYNGNEDLMQHLWINLLQNAIKFTPEGGKIIVSARAENSTVYVSIADTGIGMSQETVDQIFKKYYRANTKDPQRGLGLGLSIAHKIVKLCGGQIKVSSELGNGTVFTVELTQ